MRRPALTTLVLFACACASPPAPRVQEARDEALVDAGSDDVAVEVDERTRVRRLDELRSQLGSSAPAVVAWAAWRCGDEHIVDVQPELRKAARRWAGRSNSNAYTASVIFDALVRIGAALKPEDLHAFRENEAVLGALLVLAPHAHDFPRETLLAILDATWTDETRAARQAAGNLLAAQRSPEIVEALLERAVLVVHVDVVSVDAAAEVREVCGTPMPRKVARRDLPPWPCYVFWPDASKSVAGRIAGPVDVFWTRALGAESDGLRLSVANTTSSGRTYAADLLAWLEEPKAASEPFGDLRVVVEANQLERGLERVRAITAAARQRWARMLAALERADLLPPDSGRGRELRIGFETQDWRADKTIELPAFGD